MSAVRAEWVKFRTVRGWVLAAVLAAIAIAGIGIAGGSQGTCFGDSCTQATGPGGEAVSDSFFFVHRALAGDGSLTARVSSLASTIYAPDSRPDGQRVVVPWAKGGLIVKAGPAAGSAYAAIMVTPGHGVRMQADYTQDIAGPSVPAAWLRLARAGSLITGYASADGAHWTRVGTVRLPGLPATVSGGLFVTSPQYSQTSVGVSQVSGSPSVSVARFDHVGVSGAGPGSAGHGWAGHGWAGTNVGGPGGGGGVPGPSVGYTRSGGVFTVSGSGDIAPATSGPSGLGVTLAQTLGGTLFALIVLAVIGATFITAEYRRRLIMVTLSACTSRGRLLFAKAFIAGLVAFAAGLAGASIAVPIGRSVLRSHGVYLPPASLPTEIRVIVGTAAVLAACAVLAVAIGTIVRRGAIAVAAVIAVIVLPYTLSVAAPVLPLGVADWLMRTSPAAAFAVQQTAIQYPQVDDVYSPAFGYYPLAPWAGFAVLCGWVGLGLAGAYQVLRRRDA